MKQKLIYSTWVRGFTRVRCINTLKQLNKLHRALLLFQEQ